VIKKAVNTASSENAAAKAAAAAGKPPTSRSFLGGSKARARSEEEEESDAIDPKDAAKGKEIHRVAFTLVKETQKILKAAREKQTALPWPGTAELLSLLTGMPLELVGGSQHSAADTAEPESQAKLVDMVDAALGLGDAHGDLCALLLDGATLSNPSFTKLRRALTVSITASAVVRFAASPAASSAACSPACSPQRLPQQ
jgi:hypothetical protein